jgi:hypothetical protein
MSGKPMMGGSAMGQLVLGFRSLLVKAAVFVIMAALLAWALGGTLWPRPTTVIVDSQQLDGKTYAWRITVSAREEPHIVYRLCAGDTDDDSHDRKPIDERSWTDCTPMVKRDGALLTAARLGNDPAGTWTLLRIAPDGITEEIMQDRLAVELRLRDERKDIALDRLDDVADGNDALTSDRSRP